MATTVDKPEKHYKNGDVVDVGNEYDVVLCVVIARHSTIDTDDDDDDDDDDDLILLLVYNRIVHTLINI